jgi:hypothetical protein
MLVFNRHSQSPIVPLRQTTRTLISKSTRSIVQRFQISRSQINVKRLAVAPLHFERRRCRINALAFALFTFLPSLLVGNALCRTHRLSCTAVASRVFRKVKTNRLKREIMVFNCIVYSTIPIPILITNSNILIGIGVYSYSPFHQLCPHSDRGLLCWNGRCRCVLHTLNLIVWRRAHLNLCLFILTL